VIAEAEAIEFNRTLNETSKMVALDALVSKQSVGVQTAYAQWKAEIAKGKAGKNS
jgi:hypothetical protein